MNFMNSIALGAEDFGIFNIVGGAIAMLTCISAKFENNMENLRFPFCMTQSKILRQAWGHLI